MRVSIITVCLNSEKTLPFTLNSVLNQKYTDIEHIIIDGGSNDQTINIVNNYPFKNKKLIIAEGSKIYEAINIGIKNATGEIISILHSNDFLNSPSIINKIVSKFLETKNDILISNVVFFDKEDFYVIVRNYVSKNFQKWMLKFGLMPAHTGTFIKKKIYDEVGLYNENYEIAGDFDFFIRCFLIKKKNYDYINITTVRMKTGGISGKNLYSYIKSTSEIYKSLKKNNINSNLFNLILRFPAKIKQFIFLENSKNLLDFNLKINKHYKKFFNYDFKVIKDIRYLNLKKNFILSAFNLAFLGSYSKSEITKHENMINWPDGIFVKTINKNLIKIPGRSIIQNLEIKSEHDVKRIVILGELSLKSKLFLENKFKLPIVKIGLPYGNISKIIENTKCILKKEDLVFITLPTPKQEQLANFLSNKFENYRIICIGGSISIISGDEKEVPKWLINFEFLWRLRYETKRRIIRLFKSFFFYLYGKYISKKIKNLKLFIIE